MDNTELLKELRIERNAPQAPSRTPLWIALALIVLAAAAAGTWYALSGSSAVTVRTATAQPMSPQTAANTSVLDATGYITARRSATVSAQITGALTQVLIEEGDHVQAGQVIAKLDDTAQKAALGQTQAQLHAAQAVLVQYQAQLAQDKRDFKRMEDMVGRKLVSEQQTEQARTLVETQSAQVATQLKQIDLATASVAAAQVQLDYCTVRAPFAGVIIAKAAQVGEIVSPLSAGGGFTRTGVGTIVDMDSLEVEVDVNEAYINRVQPEQHAQTVLDAYPDWKIPSHVIAVIPTADRGKATVKVRIGIESKDARVLPDMGARVSFLEEEKRSAAAPAPKGVLVPADAIAQRDGRSVVFTVAGERVHAVAVAPGQTFGDLRQVEGVAPGATLVRAPAPELNDGARVALATDKK